MSKKQQASLFVISLIFLAASRPHALQLPYEVLETIMELTDADPDFADLNRVNVSDDLGPTRPIYRLDLDSNYIAYYEVDMGSNYVVLASGSQTGDNREVESGPDPRPTDVLLQRAQDNDEQCQKFYRLSPLGLTACTNGNGTFVAATYNWTNHVPQIRNWRELDQMVNRSLARFKSLWQERAAEGRSMSDWATTSVNHKEGKVKKDQAFAEEGLSPKSIVRVALGESFHSVNLHAMNNGESSLPARSQSKWQQRLCKVLIDVCKQDGSANINPSAIKETPNHLFYLKLEVHENRTFVGNTLQWKEIGFVVEIKARDGEVVRKYFSMDLHSKRHRRSAWKPTSGGESKSSSGWVDAEVIPFEYELPDYNQHDCCGCVSGCSPVAWAQIFRYYDSLGSDRYINSIFSGKIYRDKATELPKSMNYRVRQFVESIRSTLGTVCENGEGATQYDWHHRIQSWFKARQGSKAVAISYLESRKRRGLVERVSKSSIQNKAAQTYLKIGYPVVMSFHVESGDGHSAVATKYKEWSRNLRHCESWMTGWWLSRRRKEHCSWKKEYKYEFYLRYGWGGSNNKWQAISPYGAHIAYIAKD